MPMTDPVIAADGYSYERIQIVEWFRTRQTSPYTGMQLPSKAIMPNHNLRNTISELMEIREQISP